MIRAAQSIDGSSYEGCSRLVHGFRVCFSKAPEQQHVLSCTVHMSC